MCLMRKEELSSDDSDTLPRFRTPTVAATTMEEVLTNEETQVNYPAHQTFLIHQCEERIERPSQQKRLSKFCVDAGVLLLKLDSILRQKTLEI